MYHNYFNLYLFHHQHVKESPKLPKGTGFSRISIKRVSGVISSSLRLPSTTANEPNAVFYTGKLGILSKCDSIVGERDLLWLI